MKTIISKQPLQSSLPHRLNRPLLPTSETNGSLLVGTIDLDIPTVKAVQGFLVGMLVAVIFSS